MSSWKLGDRCQFSHRLNKQTWDPETYRKFTIDGKYSGATEKRWVPVPAQHEGVIVGQRAIPIAEKILNGNTPIIDPYRRLDPERAREEAEKLGALLADVALAREIDADLLREAKRRMERVQDALADAVGPLTENWSLKRHTETIHRIINTRGKEPATP